MSKPVEDARHAIDDAPNVLGHGDLLVALKQCHADEQLNQRLTQRELLGGGAAYHGGGLHHAVGVAESPVMPLNQVVDARVFQRAKEV